VTWMKKLKSLDSPIFSLLNGSYQPRERESFALDSEFIGKDLLWKRKKREEGVVMETRKSLGGVKLKVEEVETGKKKGTWPITLLK